MAAPTVVSVGDFTGATGTVNSLAVDTPASIVAGNMLVCQLNMRATSGTPVPSSSGWTVSNDNNGSNNLAIAYKVADGTEGATVTFSFSATCVIASAYMAQISPAALDAIGTASWNGSSTTETANSITQVAADCLVFLFGFSSARVNSSGYAITTNNPTWTERWDGDLEGGANDVTTNAATGPRSATGSTGNGTISADASGITAARLATFKTFVAGPTTVKTWDGVTQSTGIKTYMGVALASVKSVDGLT